MLKRGEWVGLGVLAIAVYAISVGTFLQSGEDSFISFRYVEQLAGGHGLVYNRGDRVEGYSNLLWVLSLVPFAWLGMPLAPVAQFLSTGAIVALASGGFLFARAHFGEERDTPTWLLWWLPLALALDPLLHYHDDRGLETVTYACGITGILLAGAAGRHALATVMGACVVLLRPEGILFAVAAAPALLVTVGGNTAARNRSRQPWQPVAIYLSICISVFLLQLGFRLFYYGEWVANTVIAKRRGGGGGQWQLISYLMTRVGLPLLAVIGFVWGLTDRGTRRLSLGGLSILAAAVVFQLRAGGLLNEGFRYLAPIFPLTALGSWMLLLMIWQVAGAIVGRVALLAGSLLLPLQAVTLFDEPAPGRPWLLQGNGNAPRSRLHVRLIEASTWNLPARWRVYTADPIFINADVGKWIAGQTSPGTVLAADQMGQLGYFAGMDRDIIDLLGLMDRRIAREGFSLEYLKERRPELLVVESCLDTPWWPESWRGRPHVASLRDAFADPAFANLYRPRYLLRPTVGFAQLGFMVYQRVDLHDGTAEPEEVLLGVDDETFERLWRVL
jgi:hypothetical protein